MSEARVKSALWVAAYVRRCHGANCPAFVTRKGDPDAGDILVAIDRLDGTQRLYGRERNAAGALVFAPYAINRTRQAESVTALKVKRAAENTGG